jgi:hypothetical protein
LTNRAAQIPIILEYADRREHTLPARRDTLTGEPKSADRHLHTLTGAGQHTHAFDGLDKPMHHDEPIETQIDLFASTAQLGLASSLIGIAVFIAAPLVAIMAAQIWAHGDRALPVALLHAWLARIAVCIPVVLVLLGTYLGIKGLRRAFRENGSTALPLAGLVLNGCAGAGWSLAAIGLLNVTESILRLAR